MGIGEIIAAWNFLQGLGTVAQIGVVIIVWMMWKNHLTHLVRDLAGVDKKVDGVKAEVSEVKTDLKEHIQWHLDKDA